MDFWPALWTNILHDIFSHVCQLPSVVVSLPPLVTNPYLRGSRSGGSLPEAAKRICIYPYAAKSRSLLCTSQNSAAQLAAMEVAKVAPNMMPDMVPTILIPASAIVAIIFGLWLWKRVSAISLVPGGGLSCAERQRPAVRGQAWACWWAPQAKSRCAGVLISVSGAGQNVFRSSNGREYLLEEEQRGDDEVRGRSRRRVPP